ncbi:hypothetical protein Rs2_37418 [Raphanus sativus]|nr:hypothetical protein Rs2_37418 [Raphanus sativus]
MPTPIAEYDCVWGSTQDGGALLPRHDYQNEGKVHNHVMKQLKGKPKKNVNFPRFIVPLECIPALNARFRERVAGCFSKCPRMCKKRFQSNSMKGYPLKDLYDMLGKLPVINIVLVPTVDEELLMARILEEEPD